MNAENLAQLVLAAYAFVAVAAVWRAAGRCEHGRRVWFLFTANQLLCGLLYRRRANRRCPFPDDGPALIVANHRSPTDPILLWGDHHGFRDRRRIRAIHFMMAREFYEVTSMNWLYRAMRCIPVDREAREAAPVRETLRRLQAGELVGIFPEGRINDSRDPEMMEPAGTGAAYLALKSKVPVYPVFIHDSPQGTGMISSFLKPARVRVVYGDPIDLSDYYDHPKPRQCLEEITNLLMRRIAELGGMEAPPSVAQRRTATIPLKRAAE